jgi:hypothetical protein
VGLTDNHVLSLLAVKLKVPNPVLLTVNEAGVGLLPPTVALIGIVCGETDKMGGMAADVKFTGVGSAPAMVTA